MDIVRSKRLRVLFIFSWSLLGVIAPLALILNGDHSNFGIKVLHVWIIIAYVSWRLSLLSIKGQKRLISITFWIFAYVFLGIAPLLQVAGDAFPWPGHYTDQTIVKVTYLVLSGLVAYDLGSNFDKPILLRQLVIKTFFIRRLFSRKAILFFSFLALLLIPLIVINIGGFELLFLPRHERFIALRYLTGGEGQAKLQILSALIRTPTFVAFLMLSVFLWFKRDKNRAASLSERFLLIALLIATLVVNNPVGSTRFWFGTIVLSSLFASFRWRPHYLGGWVLSLIILLIFVFPFADLFRNSFDVSLSHRIASTTVGNELIRNGDYDAFQQMLNTEIYIKHNGFTCGKQLLGTLLFWFPRSVWAGKPIPTGELVANYSCYNYTNLSLPLWGELYIDGGFILVIALFWLYGAVVNIIEDHYVRSEGNYPTYLNAFVPLYAAYQFFLLRGTLMSAFAYLVPVLLCMYFCTSKNNVSVRRFSLAWRDE